MQFPLDPEPKSRLYPSVMLEAREQSHKTIQIGQAAQRAGLSVDTIRFYERRSLLPKVPRTAGRFRLYSEDDIARLTFIRQMQGLGFSLLEIGQLLDLRSMRPQDCGRMREILGAKLSQIQSKIQELRKLERLLSLDLRKCERELQARKTRAAKMCPVLKETGKKPKRLPCA